MNESLSVNRFIESRLKGRSVGQRVYADFAPQRVDQNGQTVEDESVFPCIIYNQSGDDESIGVGNTPAARVSTDLTYFLKVVWRKGGYHQTQAILNDISTLDGAEGVQDGFHIHSWRSGLNQRADLGMGGVRMNYPGGFFTFRLRKLI